MGVFNQQNIFPAVLFPKLFLYINSAFCLNHQWACPIHFFFLDCKVSNKNLPFVSLLFQKIRCSVLLSFKLKLETCPIMPKVSLIFSPAFQDTEAFMGWSTRIGVQQNVMKHSFSALVVKSRKTLHVNLLKTKLHNKYFSDFNHKFRTVLLINTSRWLFPITINFREHSWMTVPLRQLWQYIQRKITFSL